MTLACTVPKEAPSELSYSWYKNHALLEGVHGRILQLHSATRADTGFYFCEVQNARARERSRPVSVVVIRKCLMRWTLLERGQRAERLPEA